MLHLWWALLPEPRRKGASPDRRSWAPSTSVFHSRLRTQGRASGPGVACNGVQWPAAPTMVPHDALDVHIQRAGCLQGVAVTCA